MFALFEIFWGVMYTHIQGLLDFSSLQKHDEAEYIIYYLGLGTHFYCEKYCNGNKWQNKGVKFLDWFLLQLVKCSHKGRVQTTQKN